MSASNLIGVLCGGPSREREISIRSGEAVHQGLLSLGLPSVLLVLSSAAHSIPDQIRSAGIHCAFIALHGSFGEDGTLQAILEEIGIPYTGSSPEACRYGMDKVASRRRWLAAGLAVPKWRPAGPEDVPARAAELKFPLILKPVSEGSSLGTTIADGPEELPQAVEAALAFGTKWILEEYLPGPELTVGILQDKPLPVIQIVPKRRFYDYTAKYTPGMTEYLVPAPIDAVMARKVQEIALRAHETLGCRCFSRADLILADGIGPVLLELNPIPGLTPLSLLPKAAAAAGISFPELCRQMLASALDRVSKVPCAQ